MPATSTRYTRVQLLAVKLIPRSNIGSKRALLRFHQLLLAVKLISRSNIDSKRALIYASTKYTRVQLLAGKPISRSNTGSKLALLSFHWINQDAVVSREPDS